MTTPVHTPPGHVHDHTDTVVDVHHLCKRYGSKVAVEDVSLQVRRGEIFGILGANGAGKTTTVEVIAGMRPPDGGTIRVLGLDPKRDARTLRQRVGIQLQQAQLPSRLRVSEALHLYAAFYKDPAPPDELLDRLGLAAHRHRQFGDLSGGQQQRLSIALALVGRPQLAILDELTTGLDPQARRQTWDLIREMRDMDVTVLLVTHYMEEAEFLCDRLAIIRDGKVVVQGRPEDITGAEAETYVVLLPENWPQRAAEISVALGGVDVSEGMAKVTGGPAALTDALVALSRVGVVPRSVQTATRSLDKAFLELTAPDVATDQGTPRGPR